MPAQWRELVLPVDANDTQVTATVAVANAVDPAIVSLIQADFEAEVQYSAAMKLVEYWDTPERTRYEDLKYLSIGAHTDVWNDITPIHGTLDIQGPPGATLTSLVLDVVEGSTLKATAQLSAAARAQLIGVPFGRSGWIHVSDPNTTLYELLGSNTHAISLADGTVTLRLRGTYSTGVPVRNAQGQDVTLSVQKLVRYAGTNRFGNVRPNQPDPRDKDTCGVGSLDSYPNYPCGGDDWYRPYFTGVLSQLNANANALAYNDFSNLNGGRFPPHKGHRRGDGVDVRFVNAALQRRDAAHLDALVALLRTDAGRHVIQVGTAFGPDFAEALQRADQLVLANGKHPSQVIKRWDSHTDHMHFDLQR